jgi:hypothetical protein
MRQFPPLKAGSCVEVLRLEQVRIQLYRPAKFLLGLRVVLELGPRKPTGGMSLGRPGPISSAFPLATSACSMFAAA